jgi:hypothetical protein
MLTTKFLQKPDRVAIAHLDELVRTENLIRFDCVTESHNVGDDGCATMLLSDAVGLAVQVEQSA